MFDSFTTLIHSNRDILSFLLIIIIIYYELPVLGKEFFNLHLRHSSPSLHHL